MTPEEKEPTKQRIEEYMNGLTRYLVIKGLSALIVGVDPGETWQVPPKIHEEPDEPTVIDEQ